MSFKSGCDISGEVVMTKIQWVQCLIQRVWFHAWSGCDIINTVVWCDRVYAMSSAMQRMWHICRVWWHQTECFHVICSGYYFINIGDMMPQIYRMWYHPYSGCDDTDTVDMTSDTVDLMPYIMWCDVLKSGCDVIQRRSDIMNTVFLVS